MECFPCAGALKYHLIQTLNNKSLAILSFKSNTPGNSNFIKSGKMGRHEQESYIDER